MSSSTTKEDLLSAAKMLVREHGFGGVSVRDLAAASGANVAAVNYHYGSKERLLHQAVSESVLEWTDHLGNVATSDSSGNPLGQMLASVRAVVDDLETTRPLFVAFLEAVLEAQRSPQLHRELVDHDRETRRRVSELVSGALGRGALGDRDLWLIASFLVAVGNGLLVQSLLDPTDAASGEELVQALTRGFAAATKVAS